MAKLAMTYYHDLMHEHVQDVKVHSSGVSACRYFKETVEQYFKLPTQYKQDVKITQDRSYQVGYPFRHYKVRFLTPKEVSLYKQYGDRVHINQQTGELTAPG